MIITIVYKLFPFLVALAMVSRGDRPTRRCYVSQYQNHFTAISR